MGFDFLTIQLPHFGQPLQLTAAAKELVEKGQKVAKPDRNRMEEALKKFRHLAATGVGELDLLEKRYLSWGLSIGPTPVISQPHELNLALKYFTDPKQMIGNMLLGLIHSYFYADQVSGNLLNLLRDRIRLLLSRYTGSNTVLLYWKNNAINTFSRDSETILAKEALADLGKLADFFDRKKIPSDSPFFYRCLQALCTMSYQDWSNKLPEVMQLIQKASNITIQQRCIDAILMTFVKQNRTEINRPLCSLCLRLFGDPRVGRNVRWEPISELAKDMVIRWVSASDIQLFFDLVDMNPDRKAFWLQYVDMVDYSRIVLGPDTLYKRNDDLQELIRNNRHGKLTQCNNNESAIILKINNVVIVELSHTGNACYVYYEELAPFNMDDIHFPKGKLKHQSMAALRLFHSRAWQDKFRSTLYNEFRIHPGRGV